MADIASLSVKRGDFVAADTLYRSALDILLSNYPPDHFDVRAVHLHAAEFYDRWGRPDLALEHRNAAAR